VEAHRRLTHDLQRLRDGEPLATLAVGQILA